jgi:flagellar motor switch protein FliM
MQVDGRAGGLTWLLPETLLLPVRESLQSENGKTTVRDQPSWAPSIGAALQAAEIEVRAVLPGARISLGELVRLAPGDIVPIEAPQQVTLLAGDVPLYSGRFGISQEHNALKITARGSA